MRFIIILYMFIMAFPSNARCITSATFDDVQSVLVKYLIRQLEVDRATTEIGKKYNAEVESYAKCPNQEWRSSDSANKLMKQLQSWNRDINYVDVILAEKREHLISRFLKTEEIRIEMQRSNRAAEWNVIAYCDSHVSGMNFLDNKVNRNATVSKIISLYKEFSEGCYSEIDERRLIDMFSEAGTFVGNWVASMSSNKSSG